jgi:hypothetical protein
MIETDDITGLQRQQRHVQQTLDGPRRHRSRESCEAGMTQLHARSQAAVKVVEKIA